MFLLLCGVGVTCSHLPGQSYRPALNLASGLTDRLRGLLYFIFRRDNKASEPCEHAQKLLLARSPFSHSLTRFVRFTVSKKNKGLVIVYLTAVQRKKKIKIRKVC